MKDKISLIYDFETLSQNPVNGVALSCAVLVFDENRFVSEKPYTITELVEDSVEYKFSVKDQVEKYGRKIQKSTLAWWQQQDAAAQRILKPSDKDITVPEFIQKFDFIVASIKVHRCYTRGNTFDPVLIRTLYAALGKEDPVPYGSYRDTRSYIEGLSHGTDLHNGFVPDDVKATFVKHDAKHDIALDVYRLQTLIRLLS
jgi:hypothetical protein